MTNAIQNPSSLSKPTKYAIYVRCTNSDAENLQLRRCAAYVLEVGGEVGEAYADVGILGTRVSNRPQLKRLMSDARKGNFDCLVVENHAHLSTSFSGCLALLGELKEVGVSVETLEQASRDFPSAISAAKHGREVSVGSLEASRLDARQRKLARDTER